MTIVVTTIYVATLEEMLLETKSFEKSNKISN